MKHGGGSCRHNVECGGSASSSVVTSDSTSSSVDGCDGSSSSGGGSIGGNVRTHTSTDTGSSGTANIPTANSEDQGACVRNRCHCTSDAYTGPYCLVSVMCLVCCSFFNVSLHGVVVQSNSL